MKIQRANYLQTLAFPAYFSVLTKGGGHFTACGFPLPYSVKCKHQRNVADSRLRSASCQLQRRDGWCFSRHQLIRNGLMKQKQNDDHAFSWPDEHIASFTVCSYPKIFSFKCSYSKINLVMLICVVISHFFLGFQHYNVQFQSAERTSELILDPSLDTPTATRPDVSWVLS